MDYEKEKEKHAILYLYISSNEIKTAVYLIHGGFRSCVALALGLPVGKEKSVSSFGQQEIGTRLVGCHDLEWFGCWA
jgi:hypothetical protein